MNEGISAASPPPRFPIVAIGGSAGALEALQEFFTNLPSQPGMALIIVMHQLRDQKSQLPELLAKDTTLPIHRAEDGRVIEPDHVYVIVPGYDLRVCDGRLVLQAKPDASAEHGMPHTIDALFQSLAQDQGEFAFGVILSGTGYDGSEGGAAIIANGGTVIAQSPHTAKFDGMPASAIEAGRASRVASPADIPGLLMRAADMLPGNEHNDTPMYMTVPDSVLNDIITLLHSQTSNDFSEYKRSTLERRILWRMGLQNIEDSRSYLQYLYGHKQEVELLLQEILIGVTCFFRDPEAWKFLAEHQLPELMGSLGEDQELRAWIIGCATGEEAYSLAIIVRECMERMGVDNPVQIFATDVDADAVEYARVGRYPATVADDIDPGRLERFFTRENDHYKVKKTIREQLIFAVHNVTHDPPFTQIDLISCRNLFIYMKGGLQKKLLPLLHYSLNRDGLLFMGASESIGEFTRLFSAVDKRWKVFRRVADATYTTPPRLPARSGALLRGRSQFAGVARAKRSAFIRQAEHFMANRFAPPSVLINADDEIVYVHGHTGEFLEPAVGLPQHRLLDMVREGLRSYLQEGLRRMDAGESELTLRDILVKTQSGHGSARVSLSTIESPSALRGLRLVTFAWQAGADEEKERPDGESAKAGRCDDVRVLRMEREMQSMAREKQAAFEELETLNMELVSANEDLQSMNEELQSSNEELETSKEEMQSLNEELTNLNAELERKITQLAQASDDMLNLLNSTEIATVFLDEKLNVMRYTENARKLFALRDADIGRPITELRSNLGYEQLARDARQVLEQLCNKEFEIQSLDGRWYWLRIMPYRTYRNAVKGLVLTFVDVGAVRQTRDWEGYFHSLVETLKQPLFIMDDECTIVSASAEFGRMFGLGHDELTGASIFDISAGAWNRPGLRERLQKIVTEDADFSDYEFEIRLDEGVQMRLLISARRLERDMGEKTMTLVVVSADVRGECNDEG